MQNEGIAVAFRDVAMFDTSESRSIHILLETLAGERFARRALVVDLLDLLLRQRERERAQALAEKLLARLSGELPPEEAEFDAAIAAIRAELHHKHDRVAADETNENHGPPTQRSA